MSSTLRTIRGNGLAPAVLQGLAPGVAAGMAPHKRLRLARERAGYDSATAFARVAGVNYTTYAHHENGRRDIHPAAARRYAKLLGLTPSMLLYGEEPEALQTVPIVATISDMSRVQPLPHQRGEPASVTLPDPTQLVATRVVGEDLYPAYRDGDLVFHAPLMVDNFVPADIAGRECMVQLPSGRVLLRHVIQQADGRFTLIAYQAPPLHDQRLRAAAPVEIVQRAKPRPPNNH